MRQKLGAALLGLLVSFISVPLVSQAASYFNVDSSGNIGIGTSNPLAKLDIVGAIYSRIVNATDASSLTIDWSSGNVQSLILNQANTTLTLSNGQGGGVYQLILEQDTSGSRTITWPSNVKWEGGFEPALTMLASSTDMATFVYTGSSYLGSFAADYRTPQALAFDSATSTFFASPSASASFTNTAGNYMVAAIYVDHGATITSAPTYNGTAMTLAATAIGSQEDGYLYYLANPATGSNTIAWNWSANASIGMFMTYSGVRTLETSNTVTSISSGTSASLTGTPLAAKARMFGFMYSRGGGSSSGAGAGTTQRTSSSFNYGGFDNNASINPVTSTTLNMTNSLTGQMVSLGGFLDL